MDGLLPASELRRRWRTHQALIGLQPATQIRIAFKECLIAADNVSRITPAERKVSLTIKIPKPSEMRIDELIGFLVREGYEVDPDKITLSADGNLSVEFSW